MMHLFPRLARGTLMVFMGAMFIGHIVNAQFQVNPHPGDVFKEFSKVIKHTNDDFRVTDLNATYPGAAAFKPNHTLNVSVGDLQGATRAELVIEAWGGHTGTRGKQFRFNSHAWINIPEMGTANGIPGGNSGQCYTQQLNYVIPVPLGNLVQGNNTLLGNSGGQTCYNFNWGQWGWYGVIVRVYYGASKPHATGSIVLPLAGSTIGENPTVTATTSGNVSQVDFLAYYSGFDTDGDGISQQYHYAYHRTPSESSVLMKNHVGTDYSSPYSMTWNTNLVPDQAAGSVRVIARIKDNSGAIFITNEVTNLTLARSGSVKIYKVTNVPQRYWVRSGRTTAITNFTIPAGDNLAKATSATMMVATWNANSGHDTYYMKVNGHTFPHFGENHFYSLDALAFPKSALHNGSNAITAYANTVHHGMEILWPGPAVIVRYSGSGGSGSPTITQQPANRTVTPGQTATFTVAATGTQPLVYQWQKNNVAIVGATNSSYTTPATTLAENGSTFRCVVSNVTGTTTSNSATLTVSTSSSNNILTNPGFESGTTGWTFFTSGAGSFSAVSPGFLGSQAGKIDITSQGTNVQLYQTGVSLNAGAAYRLSFAARSSSGHDVAVYLHKQGSPYTDYGVNNFVANLTSSWQTFTVQFTVQGFSGTVNDARLRFWLAPYDAAGDDYFIDNVILEQVSSVPPGNKIVPDGMGEEIAVAPMEFSLSENFPNPFNPSTTISYGIPEDAMVSVGIYDILGRLVNTLVEGNQSVGTYAVTWEGRDSDGRSVSSGVYFYRLTALGQSGKSYTSLKKMILMK